jgi:hypothetical protein
LVKVRPQKKLVPIICFSREPPILPFYYFSILENQRNSSVSREKKVILVWKQKPLYLNTFLIFFFLAVSEVRPEKVSQGWPGRNMGLLFPFFR